MHPLLIRQLKRLKIRENESPSIEQWHQLLQRVDKTYQESDQDRYLVNLATDVSSRESAELNSKLEQAQSLAHLGMWQFDRQTGKISWSKEMYSLFSDETDKCIPSVGELRKRFAPHDAEKLSFLINHAARTGEGYDYEVRMKNARGEDRWFSFIGKSVETPDENSMRYLSGIVIDITRRKESEAELHKLNQEIIASARMAGMAEIATSVLHNIGNILNSINVSVSLIKNNLQEDEAINLREALHMLLDHKGELDMYLIQDAKGKLLPEYILKAIEFIVDEHTNASIEISRLNTLVSHMKEIINTQNIISGVSAVLEHVSLDEVIDTAIMFNKDELIKNNVEIAKNYLINPKIFSDKNMLTQIFTNLIQNAKDAIIDLRGPHPKKITLTINLTDDKDYIKVMVTDTGVGIAKENIKNVFKFGFTTKEKGHGFGLHSSCLLIKALGGKISVDSEGKGCGATFSLILPYKKLAENKVKNYEKQI
jgi:signal transduction histidine kinase